VALVRSLAAAGALEETYTANHIHVLAVVPPK